ncbi:MAG: type II secretion system protein [Patescibacteria group bacterium]
MINKKGFTLLELVIVIGILAVLGAVSVLVLNPAQLFAQARDTTRIEDMSVLRNALALYVSTISSPDMDTALDCSTSCFVHSTSVAPAALCGARHVGATVQTAARTVAGAGWIPVNFGAVPGGPALSVLPIDPTADATYFYSYACNNTSKTYELNANLESDRYKAGGTEDKETNTKDGGNNDAVYEVGTDAGLDI